MRSRRSSPALPHQSDTRPRDSRRNRTHIGTLDEMSPLTFGIRLLIRRQFRIVAADCLDPSGKSSCSRGSKWPGLTTVPIAPPMFIVLVSPDESSLRFCTRDFSHCTLGQLLRGEFTEVANNEPTGRPICVAPLRHTTRPQTSDPGGEPAQNQNSATSPQQRTSSLTLRIGDW